MGLYNPHVPEILGEEWVGIRNESLRFSPAVNVVEMGHRFNFTASRTLVDGRFYLAAPPNGESANQVYTMNIYPAGLEAETGPIRRVVIPVNAAAVTGTAFTVGGSAPSATNYVTIFAGYGGNFASVSVQPSASLTSKSIGLFFATSQYSQMLSGKRIVGVNLLHGLAWDPTDQNFGFIAERVRPMVSNSALRLITGTGTTRAIQYSPDATTVSANDGVSVIGMDSLLASGTVDIGRPGQIATKRIRLGETNFLWNGFAATDDVMPWRYDELARFEATAGANRMWVQYDFGATVQWAGTFRLAYVALEVLFCEERRVAYGGLNCSANADTNTLLTSYDPGLVPINLRDTAFAATPAIAAGNYTVTVASADVGDVIGSLAIPSSEPASNNPYPDLNALRQLYPMPNHTGVQINLTATEDDVFTVEETDILPQLSLHTSSGPTVEPHGFGRQARAQVYGTITATQEILDSAAGGAASYPQVRFYARRFGNTTVPLRFDSTNVTGAGTYVEITPQAFDVLPDIIDGWREVTLRFLTAPSMGTGSPVPVWRWSASGELKGSRWEVLGASAPAISGVPGNLLNLAPAAHQLGATTYGGPASGATINAEWMPGHSPIVSGTTADAATDMVVLFSQDPATITGLAVTEASQELTTFTECGAGSCCIPSALQYNRITWPLPSGTGVAEDSFMRNVTDSWGDADTGGTYTLSGTASNFDVISGTGGVITFNATGSSRFATVNVGAVDFDVQVDVEMQTLVATGSLRGGVTGRYTDGLNNYLASLDVASTGVVTLRIEERVAGVATTLASVVMPMLVGDAYAVNTIRFMGSGSFLRAKAWRADYDEPLGWQLEVTDTSLTTGGGVGVFARDDSAVLGHAVVFTNLSAGPPSWNFGAYELQRTDATESEWKTIMLATSPAITGFNDYEARVGILNTYRIRRLNNYDFAGAWSSEVSRTITAPGVTLPSCGTSKRGVLIFTTNEVQDGSRNLAYAMTWEGNVEESFSFVETNDIQTLSFFDQDYQTMFHGTERGGEAFSRTLLLANAAIGNPRLADAESLRDLAWADLPYVCVRDDIGDRWLASVIVPALNARRNRRLYNAVLTVIEVTATPSPVDP